MDSDELIGATLGIYRVTGKLGQGGMGAVYKAEHPVLGRPAAIKVLLPELSQRKDLVQRFFHEAKTTAQLRHPAMVDVFDFGTTANGRAYLVMDFLDGESLETRVRKRGRLTWQNALAITRQIALGVSVAHAEQIVHRDLKPDNVFLLPAIAGNPEERVKILDFGIAKLGHSVGEAAMTRAGMLIGTPLYMSPEQCRGAHEVDHRADVYSLGCMLFTMLAGRPPFLSDAAGELIGLHQHAAPPTLASLGVTVPDTVQHLVASMLAKAPEARVQSMGGVAEAAEAIARGEARVVPAAAGGAGAGSTLMLTSAQVAGGTKLLDAPPVVQAGGTNLLPDGVRLSTLSGAAVSTSAPPKRRSSRPLLIGVAGVLVLGGAAAAVMFARVGTGDGGSRSAGVAAPAPAPVSVERNVPAVVPPAAPPVPSEPALAAPAATPEVAVAPRSPAVKKTAKRKLPTGKLELRTDLDLPAAQTGAEKAAPSEQPVPAETPPPDAADGSKPGRTRYTGKKLKLETQAPY